jgi:lysophospholipase
MKNVAKRAGLVLGICIAVVLVGYAIADRCLDKRGKVAVVNEPSFRCLPATMWNDNLATEGHLGSKESSEQLARAFRAGEAGTFKGAGGKQIAYRKFSVTPDMEKGTIVISSGRTESMLIYDELIRDLNANGYSVYIHDHRGQGLSERLTKADRQKSHIKSNFNDYVSDLHTFVNDIVKPDRPHKKLYLLAHSMGGAVASLYIEQFQGDFDAAVLVTPMHSAVPGWAAHGASYLQLFWADGYALGKSGYGPASVIDKESDLTHSRIRFERIREIYAANPGAQLGGPTHGWVYAASEAGTEAVANAGKIQIPVLILQASDDTAVDNKAQGEFCDKVPLNPLSHQKNCRGYLLPKSYHAVFNEADTYRVPALAKILDFLEHGHQDRDPRSPGEDCDPWQQKART